MREENNKNPIRHIILFKLYKNVGIDEETKAIQLLRALGTGDEEILEWRVEKSVDIRKGIVIVENGLFKDDRAYERFRKSDKHVEIVSFMGQISDWTVGDYIEP